MEILETYPRVFCFPKSHINENGGKCTSKTNGAKIPCLQDLPYIATKIRYKLTG